MSITAIKPNGGTPFDQIVRAAHMRPVPAPRHQPVVRVAVKATKSHAAPRPVPLRTVQQRMNSLLRANEIRSRRSQLKRDIKAGEVSLTSLLLDPPAYIETAKAIELMLAVPKLGKVKVNKILSTCAISHSKTIGGMSVRQRAELVELMGRRS